MDPSSAPCETQRRLVSLRDGEVHVWLADLSRLADDPRRLLDAAEREREARFSDPRKGRLWGMSRGLLRALLGAYAHCDPRILGIASGEHGKPRLERAPDGGRPLSFNLSHSGALAVYAFALDSEVGVDVESAQRTVDDVEALATRAFGTEEAARLARLDPARRRSEFLHAWVRHEAALKCTGSGLAGHGAEGAKGAEAPWVCDLDAPDAYAAVAASCAPRRVSMRSSPDLAQIPFA